MNFAPFLAPLQDLLKSRTWQVLLTACTILAAAYQFEFVPGVYALERICLILVGGAVLQKLTDISMAFAGREHKGPAQVAATGATLAATPRTPPTPRNAEQPRISGPLPSETP